MHTRHVGEPLKKAKAKGVVIDLTKMKACASRGRVKSQPQLYPVELTGPNDPPTDLVKIFLLVVATGYKRFIDPPVEDGTMSSFAILGLLSSESVKLKLLSQVG